MSVFEKLIEEQECLARKLADLEEQLEFLQNQQADSETRLITLEKQRANTKEISESIERYLGSISRTEDMISATLSSIDKTGISLKEILDRIFVKLNSSQLDILRNLAKRTETRLINPQIKDLDASQEDLNALIQLNLITADKNFVKITHNLITDYIFERFDSIPS